MAGSVVSEFVSELAHVRGCLCGCFECIHMCMSKPVHVCVGGCVCGCVGGCVPVCVGV